jgi:FkbH-like protein
MNWKRLIKYGWRFLSRSHFRNHVLHQLERLGEPISLANVSSDLELPQINSSIFLCGGCELDFVDWALRENKIEVYLTTGNGRSSDPLAEVGDPNSYLWKMNPDHIVLSNVQFFREIMKKAFRDPLGHQYSEQLKDISHSISIYEQSILLIRQKNSRPIFLLSYFVSYRSGLGTHGYLSNSSNLSHVELNKFYELELYKLAKKMDGVYIIDANQVLSNKGFEYGIESESATGYYDHFSRNGAKEITKNLLHQIAVLSPKISRVKCCVFDLDNTLWHGVLREDGPSGVAPRWNVIDAINDFSNRGILIAVCSKNDPDEIKYLPGLLDQKIFEKIIVLKLNWLPKSHNLKEIAKELNIGIDSIAFFDDNARERAEVSQNCSGIRVYTDNDIIKALTLPEFEMLGGATEETLTRTKKYQEQKVRKEIETGFELNDYESFLKSSEFKLCLERPKATEFSRIEELIQRSNQLNATMQRTEKSRLLEMYNDANLFDFFTASLSDRFGDYGLIGVIVSEKVANTDSNILELAFSCRAMGRKVEHALINYMCSEVNKRGIVKVNLNFIETTRNAEILKILSELEFAKVTDEKGGCLKLERNLISSHFEIANWFDIN